MNSKINIIKSIFALIIIFTILIGLVGCYDAKAIEDYAYVIAIGLDKADEKNLELTLQFAISKNDKSSGGSSDSSQSSDTAITSIKCPSISSGLALIDNHVSKKVNLSHCQQILISEELAKEGVMEYFDTFANLVEFRPSSNIIVTKCSAKKYLENVDPSLESLTTNYYDVSVKSSEYTGFTIKRNLSEVYSALKDTCSEACTALGNINESSGNNEDNENIDYYAGNVPIEDSEKTESLGIAVFKGDKFVGELTNLESLAHMIVTNELEECTVSVPDSNIENHFIDLNVTLNKKTRKKLHFENGKPIIDVDIYLNARGLSLDDHTSYNTEQALTEIEKVSTDYMKKIVEDYLYTTSRKFNSDIVGFGVYAVKNYLTIDDWIQSDWLGNYKNAEFNVNVNMIVKSGSMYSKD